MCYFGLVQNERLKQGRWTTGTSQEGANFLVFAENTKTDLFEVKDKLKINQEKQSKHTDVYLENLLDEDVFRGKIEELRKEEAN